MIKFDNCSLLHIHDIAVCTEFDDRIHTRIIVCWRQKMDNIKELCTKQVLLESWIFHITSAVSEMYKCHTYCVSFAVKISHMISMLTMYISGGFV